MRQTMLLKPHMGAWGMPCRGVGAQERVVGGRVGAAAAAIARPMRPPGRSALRCAPARASTSRGPPTPHTTPARPPELARAFINTYTPCDWMACSIWASMLPLGGALACGLKSSCESGSVLNSRPTAHAPGWGRGQGVSRALAAAPRRPHTHPPTLQPTHPRAHHPPSPCCCCCTRGRCSRRREAARARCIVPVRRAERAAAAPHSRARGCRGGVGVHGGRCGWRRSEEGKRSPSAESSTRSPRAPPLPDAVCWFQQPSN